MKIGIDVGASHIRIGRVENDESRKITASIELVTTKSYPTDMAAIKTAIEKISEGQRPDFIGMGVAATVDGENQKIILANNMADWSNKSPTIELGHHFDCLTAISNDATAGALAEAGEAERKDQNFWYLTWGTGIGGTYVFWADNQIRLLPSQPGHQILYLKGRKDSCGQRGCFESYVGGKAGIRADKKERIITTMAWGLANLATILPCQKIVVGGGVGEIKSEWLKAIEKRMKEMMRMVDCPKVVEGKWGKLAGILGATRLSTYLLANK